MRMIVKRQDLHNYDKHDVYLFIWNGNPVIWVFLCHMGVLFTTIKSPNYQSSNVIWHKDPFSFLTEIYHEFLFLCLNGSLLCMETTSAPVSLLSYWDHYWPGNNTAVPLRFPGDDHFKRVWLGTAVHGKDNKMGYLFCNLSGKNEICIWFRTTKRSGPNQNWKIRFHVICAVCKILKSVGKKLSIEAEILVLIVSGRQKKKNKLNPKSWKYCSCWKEGEMTTPVPNSWGSLSINSPMSHKQLPATNWCSHSLSGACWKSLRLWAGNHRLK